MWTLKYGRGFEPHVGRTTFVFWARDSSFGWSVGGILQASFTFRVPWLSWLMRLSSKQEIPCWNLEGAFLEPVKNYKHVT